MKAEIMNYAISLIYGSVRSNRQGIKAVRYPEKKLKERNIQVNFIDLLKYQLPLLDKMYKEYKTGTAPGNMETLAHLLNDSDGFLIVTGELQSQYSSRVEKSFGPFSKGILL